LHKRLSLFSELQHLGEVALEAAEAEEDSNDQAAAHDEVKEEVARGGNSIKFQPQTVARRNSWQGTESIGLARLRRHSQEIVDKFKNELAMGQTAESVSRLVGRRHSAEVVRAWQIDKFAKYQRPDALSVAGISQKSKRETGRHAIGKSRESS